MAKVFTAINRRIALQLLKEFWVPLLAAIAWTIFGPSPEPPTTAVLIAKFAPAFFFVSWMLAQLFRISKQVRTESSLRQISTRLEDVVSGLEKSAKDAVAWATGGDSYAHLVPIHLGPPNHEIMSVTLLTIGEYPLFGVQVRIVDLELFGSGPGALSPQALAAAETTLDLGVLDVPRAYMDVAQLRLGPANVDRNFNVFFGARNGHWMQQLRFRPLDGFWMAAYRVCRTKEDGQLETILQEIPEGFPNPGSLNWQ